MTDCDPLHLIGKTLAGTYQLVELIGEGGAGCVYRANHLILEKAVAVKVLKDSSHDPQAIERFRREAEVCSKLKGAGVVEVSDARLDRESGCFFLVMELLRGKSLAAHWIERDRLPVAEAVGYVLRVAEYMVVAHEHGVVHRDLTPQNIFLCQDGTIRVLDFGSALIKSKARLTRPGMRVGTTLYMPEEQLVLDSAKLDGRVDVYALGVGLYHLISGQPIFPPAEALRFVDGRLFRSDPVDIQELVPTVPDGIATVIRRATARERENRYQSMAQLVKALRASMSANTNDAATRVTVQMETPAALLQICSANGIEELPKTRKFAARREGISPSFKRSLGWLIFLRIVAAATAIGASAAWLAQGSFQSSACHLRQRARWRGTVDASQRDAKGSMWTSDSINTR